MKYHPQMTKGEAYNQWQGEGGENKWKGGMNRVKTVNKGTRHPHTVQYWKRDRGYHPTQKPVKLLEYYIRTYTDEGDTVLDFTMGSGSTGIACQNTNRNFIGIELNKEYYMITEKRLKENNKQTRII